MIIISLDRFFGTQVSQPGLCFRGPSGAALNVLFVGGVGETQTYPINPYNDQLMPVSHFLEIYWMDMGGFLHTGLTDPFRWRR